MSEENNENNERIEKFYFQSEAAEVLKMMINSVYSNRDIFLRELISNASDALDKRRIETLKDTSLAENKHPEIKIFTNRDANTISISDNGIGMSRDEIIKFLGTIAKSGTKEFLNAVKNAKNAKENNPGEQNLIGQFGVGFYSVFMAADKVEVLTRKLASQDTYLFTSTGDGSFTIQDAPLRPECGTTVTLYLKKNENENINSDEKIERKDYFSEWVIRDIVSKYSDFIAYPIVLNVTRTEDGKKITKDELLNSQKAIWQRPENEISDEDYNEFYKHLTHDWHDPLARIRINAEGSTNFKGLLFIPSEAPLELVMNPDSGGISLYINRVFIMNDCKSIIPTYLRFIRGVIDSEDLPLNISREILQDEPIVRIIRRSTQRKIFNELKKLLENDREKYIKFWNSFGRILKEGILQDRDNAQNILDIAIFRTTNSNEWTTIDEYKTRMDTHQKGVYCLAGRDNLDALKASPKLEPYTQRNLEVLLMTDPIDEVILSEAEFIFTKDENSKLLNITLNSVSPVSEDEQKDNEQKLEAFKEKFEPLKKIALEILNDQLEDVTPTLGLTDSPACIKDPFAGMSFQFERLMRSTGQDAPLQKRILELNVNHPIVKNLLTLAQNPEESRSKIDDTLHILYDQALILEGVLLPDPAAFVKRIDALMSKNMGE